MNLYVNIAAKDKIATLTKSSSLLFLHLGGERWMDLMKKTLFQYPHNFRTNCICFFTDGRFNEEKLDVPLPLTERIL